MGSHPKFCCWLARPRAAELAHNKSLEGSLYPQCAGGRFQTYVCDHRWDHVFWTPLAMGNHVIGVTKIKAVGSNT